MARTVMLEAIMYIATTYNNIIEPNPAYGTSHKLK